MTHPRTPREKVENALYSMEDWRQASPEYLIENILTALASGSGDHAELALNAKAAQTWALGIYENREQAEHRSKFIDSDLPATVLALLAEIAALRAESEARAKAHAKEIAGLYDRANTADGELDAVSIAIGTVRFMDPPDGGDVRLSEQVRRMAPAFTEAERKLAEAVGLMKPASVMFHPDSVIGQNIRTFLSKEAERG